MRLTSDWMFRLAPVLGVEPTDLLPGSTNPPGRLGPLKTDDLPSGFDIEPIAEERIEPLAPKGTVEPADIEIPATSRFSRNLPVLGTASGSIIRQVDGFRMEHEVVDYVRRPPALAKQMNAYAIFVVGESMSPMHNPGELRFVDPEQRPSIGDSVIVQTKHYDGDPGQGYIKILKRRTPSAIVLQQLNPQAVLEIPAQFIVSVHKVLTMNDLFGI